MDRFVFTKENYRDYRECLCKTAELHSVPFIVALQVLDSTEEFKGIKEWFLHADEKYRKKFQPPQQGTRKQAEYLATHLPIKVTGAQPGDILEGTRTQSLGVIVKLFDKSIPPDGDWVDTIRKFPDVWKKFLVRLGSIDFYSSLSLKERNLHLLESSDRRDLYFQDIPGLKLQVLNLGSQKFTKTGRIKERSKFLELNEKQMDKIINEPTLVSTIQSIFPFEPGSKGIKGRSTLLFRRSIWKVSVTYKEVTEHQGYAIEMKDGVATLKRKVSIISPRENVIYTINQFGNNKEGLAVLTNRCGSLGKEHVIKLVLGFHKNVYTREDFGCVERATYTFTPAAYKSLLQKILRFRPQEIDLGENVQHKAYPSDFVLSVIFALLVTDKGGLVPDIQRYVKGSESAFKRLVVTLFEDCYFEEKDVPKILALLTGALLVQKVDSWTPNDSLLHTALKIANKALNDDRAFVFSIPRGATRRPLLLSTAKSEFQMLSVMIDVLRSFTSDLEMIRDIVSTAYTTKKSWTSNTARPDRMPLEHCVDQHWAPELVYFSPLELIDEMKVPGSKPFSKIMKQIFGRVTGVNPRRPGRIGKTMNIEPFLDTFEDQPFVKVVRKMQRLLLLSRQFKPLKRQLTKSFYTFPYELDRSWIAGMLGAIEIRVGHITALVSLRPDLPEIIVAVRKPSRGMKTAILSEEVQNKAIALFEERLKTGIPLNKTRPPVPELEGAKLLKKGGEFYIKKGKSKKVLWDKFRKSAVQVSYLKKELPLKLENSLRYTSGGQEKQAKTMLKELLSSSTSEIIRRLLAHLSGYSQLINFTRIGREGGGNDKDKVFDTDIGAYQLLLKMTLLYPEAISRIPHSTLSFKVSFGPLLWEIRSTLQREVEKRGRKTLKDQKKWGDIGDTVGRKLYQHQDEAVREMILSHQRGRKGHFIYMMTGMGKTFTVFSYLKWMKDNGVLPKYIVYTTPSSAIETILREAEFMNFKTVILEPTKGSSKPLKEYRKIIKKGCKPLPYRVNVVIHDHLKDCVKIHDLSSCMSDSIFVMDEVHKALNNSLRTASALQLSRLSREMVAMTGTPIIDTKTYKLNTWLSQIVLFEVNELNFWVAANGMVAKKASTGVKVVVNEVPAIFTKEEEKAHINLVPPKIGGKNASFGRNDYSKALSICMKASNRKLLSLAREKYEKGEGVFLVAQNKKHQDYLKTRLLKTGVNQKEIFLIGVDGFLSLTDNAIEKGDVYNYRLVITTLKHVEGYNLSSLSIMITSVYPSNQAVREQLEGRINRLGQRRKEINYYVVYAGIQYFTYLHHKDGRNLSEIIATLADQF